MVCYPALRGRGLASNHIRLIFMQMKMISNHWFPRKQQRQIKKVTEVETIMLTTGEKLVMFLTMKYSQSNANVSMPARL